MRPMINDNLLRYQVKAKRRGGLFFALGLFLWGMMITAIYPTVSGFEAFSEYWGQFPESLKNLFGGHDVNILKPEGYITLEYYQLFLPIILAAFVFGFTAFCVVKARENGTLEILLTHPIQRWKYIVTSFISLWAGLAFLSVVGVGTVMLVSLILGIDLSFVGQLKFLALLYLFMLSLGSISLFASCSLNKSGQVYAVGISVLAISYVVNFLSNNWAFFEVIDHAFLYHYFDPYGTMTTAGFPWSSLLYFAVLIIVFAVLSVMAFRGKDILV
jgi:ABC-2 type transport system permease protein